ncbi:beta-taxilin-like [Tripterygium wilfordii]|uniref:beta-taxilin-like n=1 Tax=Tripterygium wilfordii TaxID=458696 RepID=UPI0018F84F63|nr:beta-taxilin-like [Tripterygium wilfordii]XP_038710213.1 beta-taxilin-like [Tripterygium wilfordii]XP_038710214.1 beta-taxilin-like [Tripterygium wilfordii]
MENPDANQLPEVDSLPDGFVDSSTEHLAPQTPTFEQEKPVNSHKDDVSEPQHSNEASLEVIVDESQKSHRRAEKEKLRTFPVPLSDSNNFEANLQSAEVTDESCVEQTEGTTVMPNAAVVSKASVGISECSEVKEQAQGSCRSSEKSIEGGSDVNTTHRKETSSSESSDVLRNGKQETAETKRKNTKRSFKSEKEFLEFTLKYQQVIAERDAAIAVRVKLESLCRELQRQNKVLMDECKRVSTEGQSLRLDLSAKFQDAIKDVSSKLEEQKDEFLSKLKENETLRVKLKQLVDQYALSEEQHAQRLKQKNLELQIADLKIKQHEEKLVQEQSQMNFYAEQASQLLATEKNLRLQLTADGEKFQQFHDALFQSNEVFETFKQEIEKMSTSIEELKKENLFLKNKSEKSDVILIELVEERERSKKQFEKMKKQKEKVESLCRMLRAERKQASTGSNSSESTL